MDDPKKQVDKHPKDEIDNDKRDEIQAPIKHFSLKDMFKLQEESTDFSLGLDIELDPDAESFLLQFWFLPVLALASIATEQRAHTIQFPPGVLPFISGGKEQHFPCDC